MTYTFGEVPLALFEMFSLQFGGRKNGLMEERRAVHEQLAGAAYQFRVLHIPDRKNPLGLEYRSWKCSDSTQGYNAASYQGAVVNVLSRVPWNDEEARHTEAFLLGGFKTTERLEKNAGIEDLKRMCSARLPIENTLDFLADLAGNSIVLKLWAEALRLTAPFGAKVRHANDSTARKLEVIPGGRP